MVFYWKIFGIKVKKEMLKWKLLYLELENIIRIEDII